jgi:hypothetical protein
MKFIVPLFVCASLFNSAFADYKPGRVRVDAEGELTATQATGIFENVQYALVSQEVKDDAGIVSYVVTVKTESIRFQLTQVQPDQCGEIRIAEATANDAKLILRLKDLGDAKCRKPEDAEWQAEIRPATEGDNSILLLKGTPEHLLLTQ